MRLTPELLGAAHRRAGIGAAWVYLFFVRGDAPLVINGRTLTEREKLIGAAGTSVLIIFFLTNVGSILFSAICIGLAGALRLAAFRSLPSLSSRPPDPGIFAHGALRVPDDLFLDPVADTGSFLPR